MQQLKKGKAIHSGLLNEAHAEYYFMFTAGKKPSYPRIIILAEMHRNA